MAKKIVYSEINDCLDCPFVKKLRAGSRYGDARCWHYDKFMVTRADKKPFWCKVDSIIVKEKRK